jgi:hypothetical protein
MKKKAAPKVVTDAGRKMPRGLSPDVAEQRIIDGLFDAALAGNVVAARFLLTHLFPGKWSLLAKPAVQSSPPLPPPDDDDEKIPGAPPFKIRLIEDWQGALAARRAAL